MQGLFCKSWLLIAED